MTQITDKPDQVVTKKSKSKKGLPSPWTFPRSTLEDAIRVARAMEDKFAGKPTPEGELAKAVGFNQAEDWRFKHLLLSAKQYGLVMGGGARADVEMAPIGENLIAPSDPHQRQKALEQAFKNVELFRGVSDHYGDKPIPEDEFFINTLTRKFEIPRDRADTFSEIFRRNLAFLKSFNVAVGVEEPVPPEPQETGTKLTDKEPPRKRTSLDTCFVMMPFGNWFDRYYREIYAPAIKDAGFDPMRADELFSSGSVVEQIWEQIQKSSVLLADLTDRNPNVFYELGLAHADIKPVVFTAAKLEDVPFDLRHLRVIIYDTREPQWDVKLRTAVTDYIRSAKKDPGKSIPHPFRLKLNGGDERDTK